jgi:hypothetical protein
MESQASKRLALYLLGGQKISGVVFNREGVVSEMGTTI